MEEGVSVQECADLESAFDVLDEDSDYDLMLLDLALPGVDGFSGLDILRRRYPAMPVVVVSAFDDPPGNPGHSPGRFRLHSQSPEWQRIAACRAACAGRQYLSPQSAGSGASG